MDDILEDKTYNWILIKKDGTYLGWSKAQEEPPNGDPENMEWVEWGKELPQDIDSSSYSLDRDIMELVEV